MDIKHIYIPSVFTNCYLLADPDSGAAGAAVGKKGKLADDQQGAPHLGQVQVHLLVFVLKDPQVADLLHHVVALFFRVPHGHP